MRRIDDKAGKLKQGKYFCFTVYHYRGGNNYVDAGGILRDMPDLYFVFEEQFGLGAFTYLVCQEEVCPDTLRPHIQGYIEYRSNQRLVALRESELWSGEVVRFVNARGTAAENKVYCSKKESRPLHLKDLDGVVFEVGVPANVGKGSRSDIISVKRAIDAGEKLDGVWQNEKTFEAMLKYHKSFALYEQVVAHKRAVGGGAGAAQMGMREVEVIVYWGPPGVGKSYRAISELTAGPNSDYYAVPMPKGSGLYFDGYVGQENVLIDEMRGSRMPHEDLLRILDRYHTTVPIHGGSVVWRPRKIILTSNYHPFFWYQQLNMKDPELTPWRALERRISSVVEIREAVWRAPQDVVFPVRRWDPPGGIDVFRADAQDPHDVLRRHDDGADRVFVGQLNLQH